MLGFNKKKRFTEGRLVPIKQDYADKIKQLKCGKINILDFVKCLAFKFQINQKCRSYLL